MVKRLLSPALVMLGAAALLATAIYTVAPL